MRPPHATTGPGSNPAQWSASLEEVPPGGSAKFHITCRDRVVEGFVVNFAGRYYAYANYCAHAGTPLDWWPNEFFDGEKRFLTCGTHGALYEPSTGKCVGGPCAGRQLMPLALELVNGRIVVTGNLEMQYPSVHGKKARN